MDVEKINFKKLFRDIRLHVDVSLKLHGGTPMDFSIVAFSKAAKLTLGNHRNGKNY